MMIRWPLIILDDDDDDGGHDGSDGIDNRDQIQGNDYDEQLSNRGGG